MELSSGGERGGTGGGGGQDRSLATRVTEADNLLGCETETRTKTRQDENRSTLFTSL